MSFGWGYLFGHSAGRADGFADGKAEGIKQATEGSRGDLTGGVFLLLLIAPWMAEGAVIAYITAAFIGLGDSSGFGLNLLPVFGILGAILALLAYLALHINRGSAIVVGIVMTPLWVLLGYFMGNPAVRCSAQPLRSLVSAKQCIAHALHPATISWGWMVFAFIAAVLARIIIYRAASGRWQRITSRRKRSMEVSTSPR